jgi:cytochrome b561
MNIHPYPASRRLLHWLTLALLLAAAGLGLYMTGLKLTPTKLQLYSYHKWIGVTVFLVVLARLWLAGRKPVPDHPAHAAWQHLAAVMTHRALYLLLVLIPVSGWLMSSAKGFQTVYLGIVPLPDLVAKDKELGELLAGVHQLLNLALAGLVAAHVGAAVWHHVILRDGLLRRMWPAREDTNKAADKIRSAP